MQNSQKPSLPLHVAMVPTPGMGHLIPLVEFANRLVSHHTNFEVTIIVPNDGSPMKNQRQLLQALPNSISSTFLPPPISSFDDLPHQDARIESRIILSIARSLPALKASLQVLLDSTRLVALVVDVFGMDAIDVFNELGLKPFIFFPTTAMLLQFMFHLPKFDDLFSCEYRDLPDPIKLPGCVPFQGRDVADPVKDKKHMAYQWFTELSRRYTLAAGIMVNSFMDLEQNAFKALMESAELGLVPPIYPVGPLIQNGSTGGVNGPKSNIHHCIKWLDKQPIGSVVYVCFGSGGTLSNEQLNELAMGLEASGQRFVWVVKRPNDKSTSAAFFGVEEEDPFHFLPNGFMERTKEIGLIVPSWAPQVEVLKHGSTGGFVTHCGWNSTLEAIVHGVPLIAWPLYAEQKMNAVLLADDLKVAWRVKEDENGVVGREDIAKLVKGLIEGEEGQVLRSKMREFKDTANVALSKDGLSTKSLAKVAEIWKNREN